MKNEKYFSVDNLDTSLVEGCRQGLHKDAITQYQQVLDNAGGEWVFPPLQVVILDGVAFVLDGQHRLAVAKDKGVQKVPCTIKPFADLQAAKRYALCANSTHGEKLTREEMRANIREYLRSGGAIESDTQIAKAFGVSNILVGEVRKGVDGMTKDQKRTQEIKAVLAKNPEASVTEIAKVTGIDRKTIKKKLDGENLKIEKIPNGDIILDCNGNEVPQDHTPRLKNMFKTLAETNSALHDFGTAFSALADAGIFPNTREAEIIQTAMKQIRAVLRNVKPDALCTCRGDGCRVCGGVGFLSKERYKVLIPSTDQISPSGDEA